jgi:hypothetical protein
LKVLKAGLLANKAVELFAPPLCGALRKVIFPTNWGANWGAKLFKSSHLIVFNIFLDIMAVLSD